MPSFHNPQSPQRQPSTSTSTSTTTTSPPQPGLARLPLVPLTTHPTSQQQQQPVHSQGGRIVFTRQLWKRRMPNEPIEVPVSRQTSALAASEHPAYNLRAHVDVDSSRRTSSTASTRSIRQPTSPTLESRTPLTPEESPPYRSTRKRNTSNVEEDERSYHSVEPSPTHSRANSSDQAAAATAAAAAAAAVAAQVCICQPDPKIPRPRNAFILYRQHHQAKVIAEHPGLANPEISKIIGEQWRNQPADVKNEWKRLAEEEKVRHQQQYPTYRYQPRRNTRRNSLGETAGSASSEKPRCPKCGGRTIIAPANFPGAQAAASSPSTSSLPPSTPSSSTTPLSRTLPVLGDLSLQSPATRRMGRPFPGVEMSPRHFDERDDAGTFSPDSKRRRYNNDQPMYMYRAVPPRYAITPGTAMSPGTPFPFAQAQHPHPYSAAPTSAHVRGESLPSLHMMSPPGPMPPPPRPGMGYQQHRLSQGHAAPDRSLILPPLQTGGAHPAVAAPAKTTESKSAQEVIMSMPLSDKLEVLRRIAPPAKMTSAVDRGPLIAIEGDSVDAAQELSRWLVDILSKDEEIKVKALESPNVTQRGDDNSSMAEYHLLAADWLARSRDITNELTYNSLTTPAAIPKSTSSVASAAGPEIKEQSDTSTEAIIKDSRDSRMSIELALESRSDGIAKEQPPTTDSARQGGRLTNSSMGKARKPVLIVPAFSLHTTNVFSCRIPITDVYSPKEHWQWSATLWRGIIGPDLTIYVRDTDSADFSRSVEQSELERLFVVKRNKVDGSDRLELDSATLRRVGFEVSEWIRAHGTRKRDQA